MFSPIVATALMNTSFNVAPSTGNAYASSAVLTSELIRTLSVLSSSSRNNSFLATKSVSELTSTMQALFPSEYCFAEEQAEMKSLPALR